MPSLRELLTSSITRIYPFYSGCGTFANSRAVRVFSGFSSGKTWAKLSEGGEVFADLDDYVGRAAYFVGDLDKKITWLCKKIIKEGDTVLDIGANIGIVTVKMAQLVGKNGRVHSFEPNPTLCMCLEQTIKRNKFINTKLHPIALGPNKTKLN